MRAPENRNDDFFSKWETIIEDLDQIRSLAESLDRKTLDNRQLVWRGQRNAEWPLHSSLARFIDQEPFAIPTESSMLALEQDILKRARSRWRFDDKSALQIQANIQHFGGLTRLIDATFNPFVALWFAVEEDDQFDSRLFAITPGEEVVLDQKWGGREIPWEQGVTNWLTKAPLLWRPPSYNERISAQNALFLISGVPRQDFKSGWFYPKDSSFNNNFHFELLEFSREVSRIEAELKDLGLSVRNSERMSIRKVPTRTSQRSELREYELALKKKLKQLSKELRFHIRDYVWAEPVIRSRTSVPLNFSLQTGFTESEKCPSYTFRIPKKIKADIRKKLDRQFGINEATLFPDFMGLSKYCVRKG